MTAVARKTDPETSWEAAASVDIKANQRRVLTCLALHGPLTDEALVTTYELSGLHPQSPSGIRTRRKELVEAGRVQWTGQKVRGRTNRMMRLWEAV